MLPDVRLRGYILTEFSYKWVWNYRNRWDAATSVWNCVLNTSQSVKICRAKKKHLAKGYAKVARAHFVLNLWLCLSLWSHNDKVLNWTTCWKDTTISVFNSLLMPVQLSMKQLNISVVFHSVWHVGSIKPRGFFIQGKRLKTRHWLSFLQTKVSKKKMTQ